MTSELRQGLTAKGGNSWSPGTEVAMVGGAQGLQTYAWGWAMIGVGVCESGGATGHCHTGPLYSAKVLRLSWSFL